MKSTIFQLIKPSALTWFIFVMLILLQASCSLYKFNLNDPKVSTAYYGLGSPIEIFYHNNIQQTLHVNWIILSINLMICYLLSSGTAWLIKKLTQLRKPFLVYGGASVLIVCGSFFAALIVSKFYWGYVFHRPDVLLELHDVTKVISVIPVITEQTPSGLYHFVLNPQFSIAEAITCAQKDPNYVLDERILIYLNEKNLLPESPTTSIVPYTEFYTLLPDTKLLAEPEEGYTSSGLLIGVIIPAYNKIGEELVFFSATGQQVSNDHFPFYEMVFKKDPQSGELTFIHGQRFFFDVAGMECFEWSSM
jgi:hypothetical protein